MHNLRFTWRGPAPRVHAAGCAHSGNGYVRLLTLRSPLAAGIMHLLG
jgi:hypothetical protein